MFSGGGSGWNETIYSTPHTNWQQKRQDRQSPVKIAFLAMTCETGQPPAHTFTASCRSTMPADMRSVPDGNPSS